MNQDGLGDLVSDGVHRVERCHRILEDDRALLAAEILHLLFTVVGDILAFVEDLTLRNVSVLFENLHDGVGSYGFSRTRLTNDAKRLAFFESEADAVYCLHLAVISGERSVQVDYLKQGSPACFLFQISHLSLPPELGIECVPQTVA